MNYLKKYSVLYGIILVLLIGNIVEGIYIYYYVEKCSVNEKQDLVANIEPLDEPKEETKEIKHLFVDIKGYVKSPGVYEVS